MVELKPLNEENFEECTNLDVREEQQDFVAENLCSIAEAYVSLTSGNIVPMPYCVFDAEQGVMVGFIMLGYCEEGDEDIDEPYYCIWRLMTDANCQNVGYGTAALAKAIELIKEMPLGEAKKLCVSYTAENSAAARLFTKAGLIEVARDGEGNVLAVSEL